MPRVVLRRRQKTPPGCAATTRAVLSRGNAALVLVIAVGAALRTIGLDHAPPGLFFDEAADGLDALDVLAGHLAIFFTGDQGREPLHIYAVALATALVGPGWLAVRLPSVIAGTATISATYLLGREVGGRWLGLLSALLLATSYWHVSLSRLGFRAVWVPLVVALTLALLLRALRTRQLTPAILCGVVMGIGLYSYISARMVPALALAVVLAGLALSRRWRRWPVLAVPFAVAVVIVAPLAAYFASNPVAFWQRVENLSGWGLGFGERVWNAFGVFLWAGDDIARHNLPFRPVFDPIAGGLFLVGLVVCLARWRRPAYLALLAGCGLMLLPQVLATGYPHFLRAAGVLPPAQTIAAVGLVAVVGRLRAAGTRWAVLGALAAFWASLTAYQYFALWAPSREVYFGFEAQGREASALIRQLPPGEAVSAGSWTYGNRATFFLDVTRPGLVTFDEARAIVVPAEDTRLVLPAIRDLPDWVRARLGAPVATAGRWRDEDGHPAVAVYRLGPAALAPRSPLAASVGKLAAIEGYDIETVVRPGAVQHFDVIWRPMAGTQDELEQFAHVVRPEPDGEKVWADHDVEAYPSRQWRGGETVMTWFTPRLPADAPVGAYWIATGFYELPSLRRLPIADAAGRPAGDRLLVGPFKVWGAAAAAPRPTAPLAVLDGGILLASAGVPERAAPGAELAIDMSWWAARPTTRPLTVFLHLLDESNQERAGADGPPAHGLNPTQLWQPGERIRDPRTLRLPANLPAGRYTVEAGLYDPTTGERLRLLSAADRLGDAAIVGHVDVR